MHDDLVMRRKSAPNHNLFDRLLHNPLRVSQAVVKSGKDVKRSTKQMCSRGSALFLRSSLDTLHLQREVHSSHAHCSQTH